MAQASAQQFGGWYDTAAITAWAAALAVQIEGIQRALTSLTDAYLARAVSMLTGSRFRPAGRVDVTSLRQGITHAGAYARAADVYRWQQSRFDNIGRELAQGVVPSVPDLIDPIQAAVDRVVAVADMDAQMAVQAQEHATLTAAADKGLITGYRRVIHPELSKGGVCGLCVAASDRLYKVAELKPLHSLCKCTTLPVTETSDPGSQLNTIDLRRLYKAAGSTGRADLKGVRVQVDEHGELGPILTRQGQPIRTARQAARDANKAKAAAKSAEQVAADLGRLRASLEAALPKARDLAKQDPATWGNYLTKLEARIKDLGDQIAA